MRKVDVVITGHRPKKLPKISQIDKALVDTFMTFNVSRVIQGMADGVDLISARTAYRMKLPFLSVSPGRWHKPGNGWERDYKYATELAQRFEYSREDEKYLGPWVFQKRNEFMIDKLWRGHEGMVIAVWDGSPSGTANCVKYALEKSIRVWRIDPSTFKGEYVK